MNDLSKRPLRTNVLMLAVALAIITVGSIWVSTIVTSDGVVSSLLSIATISVTGLVGFGKDILKLDDSPFDAQEAAHKERIAEMEGAGAVRMRQIELDHEYRNGQNEAFHKLIDAATGRAAPSGASA